MKRKIVILFMLLSAMFTQPVMGAEFSDVPVNHWAYETISRLADNGIINGMGDGTYNPNGTLTRAQFIKLLTCGLEDFEEGKEYTPVFYDTYKDAWYTNYVTCGVESGIIEANDNLFYPEKPITRGEAAIWIVNGMGIEKNVACKFLDVSDAEQKRAVAIAADRGIINGYEDGNFRPDNTLTRAEASALIARTMEKRPVFGQVREDSKNEIVMKESVKVLQIGENNRIKKADGKQKTVTFSSPSETVKNLKKGDVLYIPETEMTGEGFVKVTSVKKSGNDIIIGVGSPELSDVLESIDISAVVSPSAEDLAKNEYVSDINPSGGAGNGSINAAGSGRNSNMSSVGGLNIDADASIDPEAEWRDGKLVWKVPAHGNAGASFNLKTPGYEKKEGAYASLDMSMNIFLDVEVSGENFDGDFFAKAEVDSDITAIAGFSASKEASKSIELPSVEFSVSGPITVEVTPYIVATASGEFKVEATANLTNNIGCELKGGELTTWSDPKIEAKLEADAEGYLEIGPRMVAELGLIDFEFKILGKEIKIDAPEILNFTADLGLGINGKTEIKQKVGADSNGGYYEGHQNTPDANGVIHHCSLCVSGEIYEYDSFSFGLSDDLNDLLDGLIGKKLTYESEKATFVFSPWYYSVGEWGSECELALCPHKLVRVSGSVTEKDTGEKISGATVKAEAVSAYTDFEKKNLAENKSDIADENGRYEMFLEPGGWKFTVTEEAHEEIETTVFVPDDKEINKSFIMELKDIVISGFVKNSKTGEAVSGAKISAGEESAVSGYDGYFELKVKPKDTYGVKVTCDGFLEKEFSIEVKTEDITQNISLDPDDRWQEAYRSIIKKEGGYSYVKLADLDHDDIPELIISGIPGSGLFSGFIKGYSYKNGKVQNITADEYFQVSFDYERYKNNVTGEFRMEGKLTVRGGWASAGGSSGIFYIQNNELLYNPVHGWYRDTRQEGKNYIDTYTYHGYNNGISYNISEADYNYIADTMHNGWTKDTTYKQAGNVFYRDIKNSDINELYKNYDSGVQ